MNARMQKEMCEIALIMDSAGGCDCLCLFSFFHSLLSRLLLELRLEFSLVSFWEPVNQNNWLILLLRRRKNG
jgi:hypothetical protein